MALSGCEKSLMICITVSIQYQIVTDRWTDGQPTVPHHYPMRDRSL